MGVSREGLEDYFHMVHLDMGKCSYRYHSVKCFCPIDIFSFKPEVQGGALPSFAPIYITFKDLL